MMQEDFDLVAQTKRKSLITGKAQTLIFFALSNNEELNGLILCVLCAKNSASFAVKFIFLYRKGRRVFRKVR